MLCDVVEVVGVWWWWWVLVMGDGLVVVGVGFVVDEGWCWWVVVGDI